MKINCFSITFWFDIFENHNDILEDFQEKFREEFNKFDIFNYTDNLVTPIIRAISNKDKTNLTFSQINLQYNMDFVNLEKLDEFKEKCLEIYEILNSNNIEVKHTAIYMNREEVDDESLNTLTQNYLKEDLINDDLVDVTLKIGRKIDDLFYKIITLLNKKQIKLPREVDEKGRVVPIPLISWNGSIVENEIIDISYEINDKYSFDFTKNYHTTEFYLNKMLYIFGEDIQSDINEVIK